MASFIPKFNSLSDLTRTANDVKGVVKQLTSPSLTSFTKGANVMSRLYIEDTIMRDDICVPLVGTLNQLYVSYILAALNLDTMCANGRTVREQFEIVATENYDIIDEILTNFGKNGCEYSNEETVVRLEPDTQRLPVGRVIELSMTGINVLKETQYKAQPFKNDKGKKKKEEIDPKQKYAVQQTTASETAYQFKAYLYVQLVPYVLTSDVVEGYITANFDPPMNKRWTKYRAGEISFWRDFILARDLIEKQAKTLKQDKNGVILNMMQHQQCALSRWWGNVLKVFSGRRDMVSHNLANTILITSKATFDKSCRENSINFADNRQRQMFFNKTWSMIVCVVDPLYNTVDMYFNGVDMKGTYNFAMINKVGAKGQDNFDLKEVMSAFSQGLTPKF